MPNNETNCVLEQVVDGELITLYPVTKAECVQGLSERVSTEIQPTVQNLQTSIDTKADSSALSTTDGRVENLQQQVNNIARLPEGSTTGDAEIVQARVGVDGINHINLKTRLDTEMASVKKDLNDKINLIITGEFDTNFTLVNRAVNNLGQLESENLKRCATQEVFSVPDDTSLVIRTSGDVIFSIYRFSSDGTFVSASYNKNFYNCTNEYGGYRLLFTHTNNTLNITPSEVINNTTYTYSGKSLTGAYTEISKISNKLNQKYISDNDKFVRYTDGAIVSFTGGLSVLTFPVSVGMTVIYDYIISSPDQRGIAFYDINNNFILGEQIGTESKEIAVPDNAFTLKATVPTANPKMVYIKDSIDAIEKLNRYESNKKIVNPDIIGSKFISYLDGKATAFPAGTMSCTDYIATIPNVIINASNLGFTNTTQDSRGLAFYDSEKNFISGYQYPAGIKQLTLTTPENCHYFRMTVLPNIPPTISVDVSNGTIYESITDAINRSSGKIVENPIKYKGKEVCVFSKGLCIGDSLTEGVFNRNDTGTVIYQPIKKYSYPAHFQKMSGVEMDNWGVGGATTKSWYNSHNTSDYDWSGHDFAIINLGANDKTTHDITVAESKQYLQLIIDKLKSANKGIKIFVATILPAYYTTDVSLYSQINTTRTEIVSTNEDCYLIDLSNDSECKNGTAYAQGHLTAVGYRKEAEELIAYISYIISQNLDEFKWVQFIGTNWSYS